MQQRDSTLINDLVPLAVQDYEYLRYSNDRSVKDAFLSGDVREPNLYYTDIDPLAIEERSMDVRVLESVVEAYSDELVRRAHLPKLREIREKYELLRAVQAGDDVAVLDASIRLYGRPREDLFRYALRHLRTRLVAVRSLYATHPVVGELIARLEQHASTDVDEVFPWDSIAFPAPRRYVSDTSLSATEIQRMFTAAFLRYGVDGWQAIVDAPGERTTFNTNHDLCTVFIPSDADIAMRKYALTPERVEALIAHEIGTHVTRRARGEHSPLSLLGVGLAEYLRGEEGIATYVEQQVDGTRHFAGGLGYLCVGWAIGIDGTPRTFRGLYDVLYPYLVVSALEHALQYQDAVDVDKVLARSARQAWARCVRVFRGTSGTTPGACFTKDIVYLEGNIAIWQLVSQDPTWVDRFSLGKYDPANEEHVSLLRDLGML